MSKQELRPSDEASIEVAPALPEEKTIQEMVRHIREALLKCSRNKLASLLKEDLDGVMDMEEADFAKNALERTFVHRYTKLLKYLQIFVQSPPLSLDPSAIQSAIKSLATALMRAAKHHQDHSEWTRCLSEEELLTVYPRSIVGKILDGRKRKGMAYNTIHKTATYRPPTPSLPKITDEMLPAFPLEGYIAHLLYDYAHSGQVTTACSSVHGKGITLYRDRLSETLKDVLYPKMRHLIRVELRISSPDEINMDDIIKRAYKELIKPKARHSSTRYGRTGTDHHSTGIKEGSGRSRY